MEVLVAVCDLMGIDTGVDVCKIQDVAEDLVRADDGLPDPHRPRRAARWAMPGCTAASCCLPSAPQRSTACRRARSLVELGRRGMVGGQEDMIEDTALTMARERGLKLPA